MSKDIMVLGAGIVGVSIAIHLARRGKSVLLVDRKLPSRETSFGNGGIIQNEGVHPYAFPRKLAALFRIARNRNPAVRYDIAALGSYATTFAKYWWHSSPHRYREIVRDYANLTLNSSAEHADLAMAAAADELLERRGWIRFYRTSEAWGVARADADLIEAEFGIRHKKLSQSELKALEPNLSTEMEGAIHWIDSWTVNDPGALLDCYLELFRSLGGAVAVADAMSLREVGTGHWRLDTSDGVESASDAVIALGPWSGRLVERLGYRIPLFTKRGYHMHYGVCDQVPLNNWVVDAENGYLIAPMRQGIRLTTGAEFASLDSKPTPHQLDEAEAIARRMFPLGKRLEESCWLGARPCTSDMKPVIGAAGAHAGLWFAFGHAHHGLTMGPLTGRLVAEQITGEKPLLDLAPFAPTRFFR